MNWEAIGAVGEVAGAVGVIVTLIAYRAGRSAAWHRPPTVAEAPKVEARRLPRTDWNPVGPGGAGTNPPGH